MNSKISKAERRVLLVNDELIDHRPVSEILENAGYSIQVSLNGANALSHLLLESFDLVVYDLLNSELCAIEILGQLRRTLPQKKIQVLFLTDTNHSNRCRSTINNKNIDFLARPFGREELFRRINSRLDFHQARHEILEKESIMESLKLAQRIQRSLLPDETSLKQAFSDHFVLDLPLNVVSGDFHWIKKINNTILFALADSTGHGVPAALISVLAISLMNEITIEAGKILPNELLDRLRARFNSTLLNHGENGNSWLGLDIVLVAIDLDSGEMTFSGAYNSLFIARKGEIIEVKGDPQPVGLFPEAKPYGLQSIMLQPGDELYASSDGYGDQFGGRYGRKLQKRNFITILQSLSGKPMQEQNEILYEKHLEWKGACEQVDDILVMGFKI